MKNINTLFLLLLILTPHLLISQHLDVEGDAKVQGSLILISPGTNNTFIGETARTVNTGNNNTFLGYQAGLINSTGLANTFLGTFAGFGNTTGNFNTFIGASAGVNSNGFSNTFLGRGAGGAKTSGDNNVFLGFEAGQTNISGSGNVFIGYQAGKHQSGSNLLIIGSGESSPLIHGSFDDDFVQINGRLGIGFVPADAALNVRGISGIGKSFRTESPSGTTLFEIDTTGTAGFGQMHTSVALNVRPQAGIPNALRIEDQRGKELMTMDTTGRTGFGHGYPNVTTNIRGIAGDGFALYVENPVGAELFSVEINGVVDIPGTLSKGAGTFKIDHPLDPENKYLYHSFVESPDMMNVYNGNIITGADAIAEIDLPDYFMALNKDYRYQLTVIGTFAQAIVKEEVVDNKFIIETSEPNVKVSWQVTGIRQDAFANKNRIQVEVDKNSDEQGYFLHPEAHGKGMEKRIRIGNEEGRIQSEKK